MWRPRRAHRPAYIEVRLLGSLYEGGPRLRVGDADEEMLVIGPARSNLNGAVPMYLEVSRNLLDHVNAVGAVAVNGENVVGDFNEGKPGPTGPLRRPRPKLQTGCRHGVGALCRQAF